MNTSTTATDTLPSTIPILKRMGDNWLIFKLCFKEALAAKHKWGHFNSSKLRPVPRNPPTEAETKALEKWDDDEAMAKYLLSQCIPNKIAISVSHLKTVQECWDWLINKFTPKSEFAKTQLCMQFMASTMPSSMKVPNYLATLCSQRVQVAAAVEDGITNNKHRLVKICSLPSHLASFANAQLKSHQMQSELLISPLKHLRDSF